MNSLNMLASAASKLLSRAVMCFFAVMVTGAAPGRERSGADRQRPLHFTIPKAPHPPALDGRILDKDWASALRIENLRCVDVPAYADGQLRRWIPIERPMKAADDGLTFLLMWDAGHLYIAGRSLIPEATQLTKQQRPGRPLPPLFHDDAFEFAIDVAPVDPVPGAAHGVLMCIFNAFGLEQARKLARDYRPYGLMPQAEPDLDIATEVWTDAEGQHWWDLQVAFDSDDLGLSKQFKGGDRVRISLARIFQFPWRYSCIATTSPYMDSGGFPVFTLTEKSTTMSETRQIHPPEKGPRFLDFTPARPPFAVDYVRFDHNEERLFVQVDVTTADQMVPEIVKTVSCSVSPRNREDNVLLTSLANDPMTGLFEPKLNLSDIPAGEYHITISLLDATGTELRQRTLKGFDKIQGDHGVRYLWWRDVATDSEALARHEPLRNVEGITEELGQWHRQKTAAGNVGDYYHNHDHLHSYLALQNFPQVTPIDATDASRSLIGAGLQHRKLFTGTVIGNASMVAGGVSLPEHAYRNPQFVDALHDQYTNNHVYLYPSHTTQAEDYSAYTPYVIVTRGSSGSEQRIMEALFATLAAFRPETKQRLRQTRAIAPMLQMILRRHYRGAETDADYLSGKAHPVIFNGKHIEVQGMVAMAHQMRVDRLPPVVRLKVLSEDFGAHHSDGRLFTTPGAVARLARDAATHTMTVSARQTVDANGRDLSWRWVLLRGDPEQTKVETLDSAGSTARLTFMPQAGRVDVAVFASNAVYWSAPAIVSCRFEAE